MTHGTRHDPADHSPPEPYFPRLLAAPLSRRQIDILAGLTHGPQRWTLFDPADAAELLRRELVRHDRATDLLEVTEDGQQLLAAGP